MKLSSLHLEAFFELAKQKNFSLAAKSIFLSQPAFSHRIRALEDTLETTLVIRNSKQVELTDAGVKLFQYCKDQKQLEDDFVNHFFETTNDGGLKGHIRLGGFSSVTRPLALQILKGLFKENPYLNLHLVTKEMNELIDLLKSSHVDFVLYDKIPPGENFEYQLLGFEENVLVEANLGTKDVYLDHDENDRTTLRYFEHFKMTAPHKRIYLDDVYGILDGVKLGFGRAILPKHLLRGQKLKIRYPKQVLKTPVYLVYHKSVYRSHLHQRIIEEFKKSSSKFIA